MQLGLGLTLLAASSILLPATGETVDRVVASIGNTALTASDVEREYRFELFLNGQPASAPPDLATRERVRDRLIEQRLLAEEAEAENVERTNLPAQAAATLAEVRQKYPSKEAWQAALRTLEMDEREVLQRLEDQALVLRIIDQRLRPAAWVERAQIEAYYQKTFGREQVEQAAGPAPALEEVENQIREILVQEKINQLLPTWLQELKASRRVRLYSF
jgi:hypothetical protein